MKKKSYRIPALLLLWLWGIMLLPLPALASQPPAALWVGLRFAGDAGEIGEGSRFRLTAVDGAPMPEDGQDSCEGVCTGDGNVQFPAIPFRAAGIYHYTLSRSDDAPGTIAYGEAQVYTVTVTVMNTEDGGLTAVIALRYNGIKTDKITFSDVLDRGLRGRSVSVCKHWDDGGQGRPDEVTVQLISRDTVLGTAVLNEANDWSYTWEGLVTMGAEWHVLETPVPAGYAASYDYEDDTVTITNRRTPDLMQTGQLVWPIWVLGGAGALLAAVGFTMLIKGKKRDA